MATLAANSESSHKHGSGLLSILERNPKRLERIKFLAQLFETEGYELRIAGGAVRDILKGVEPQDIDFATTARPEQSKDILTKHEEILRIIDTDAGMRHGTVAVKFKEAKLDFKRIKLGSDYKQDECQSKDGDTSRANQKPEYDEESPFEITTLRRDTGTDGRHAKVEFVNNWRIDAERRDLTINAMFLTLNEGKLIDYFGGKSDLENGVVRFVGDADSRIKEDYLRILRYFRFWSRYSKYNGPDPETIASIKRNLEGLNKISGERLWQEIKKIFSHIPCYEVAKLMLELDVFRYVGLYDDDMKDHEKYVEHTLKEIKAVEPNISKYNELFLEPKCIEKPQSNYLKKTKQLLPVFLFAAAVQTQAMCENAHQRVKFSNMERDSILFILEHRLKDLTIQKLKHQLAMADSPHDRHIIMRGIRSLLVYKGMFKCIEELESWRVPDFPITGQEIAREAKQRGIPLDKIKFIKQSLKSEWAARECELSKEELERIMLSKLDQMTV